MENTLYYGNNLDANARGAEELTDSPMDMDCGENEDQGHPWPICGRVIWVLNRFIEEPKSK